MPVRIVTFVKSLGSHLKLEVNCVFKHFHQQTLDIHSFPITNSPEIDSRKARHGLLKAHSDILGSASAFDGSILFLPKELEKPVSGDLVIIA